MRKLNEREWQSIEIMYENKFTSEDIATILGIGASVITRGLNRRGAILRESGIKVYPTNPVEFTKREKLVIGPELFRMLSRYYLEVKMVKESVHVLQSPRANSEQLKEHFGYTDYELTILRNILADETRKYGRGIHKIPQKDYIVFLSRQLKERARTSEDKIKKDSELYWRFSHKSDNTETDYS